ncbi:hypothetical protein [Runella limosa]|uniref:hypothetical protein n=1 Tax=Runella limosa TaxID=370978 RepID=UPI0004156A0A|nr:hypothetical protein [Runella limosa]
MTDEKLQHLVRLINKIDETNKKLTELSKNDELANKPSPHKFGGQEITELDAAKLDRKDLVDSLKTIFEELDLGLLSRFPRNNLSNGPKYLAHIDILGFKQMLKKNNQSELERIFEKNIKPSIQDSLIANAGSDRYEWQLDGTLARNLRAATINSIVFSDTLIFWTNDDTAKSFLQLINVISNLFHLNTNYFHIPLRGAIAYGSLKFEDPLFVLPNAQIKQTALFGEAIVDAYELEQIQNWLGCAISRKSIDAFHSSNPSEEEKELFFKNIIDYSVPIKKISKFFGFQYVKKSHMDMSVLQWVDSRDINITKENVYKCFTINTGTEKFNPDVKCKFDNTMKFVELVLKNTLT